MRENDGPSASGKDEKYAYDDLNRLTGMERGDRNGDAVNNTNRAEDFTLDQVGNWKTYQIDADGDGDATGAGDLDQDRTVNDANEVTGITEQADPQQTAWADPVYSARGNTTTIPQPSDLTSTYSATYDAWNRLVEIKDGANVVARFEYDGLNRRVTSHLDTDETAGVDTYRHFFYNSGWQILETRKTATEAAQPEALDVEMQYVWSARYVDAAVLRDENKDADGDCIDGNDERLYYTGDANMNVTALVDADGDVVERYVYDPYGRLNVLDPDFSADADGESDYANAILYCGYYHDWETGLYHVRHRSYHLALGRWLQRDPIGYVDRVNLYEYARTSPVTDRDPDGLQPTGGWGNWGVPVPPSPPEYNLAAKIGLAYLSRVPRGYLGNLLMNRLLGQWDIDDLVVSSADLSINPEIRRTVDSVMADHAKELCSRDADDYEVLSYSRSFEFHDFPLSGILGTGTLSATGDGSVWEQTDCESCAYVYVRARWRYQDEIDMLDFRELYKRGFIYLSPRTYYDPLAILTNLGSLAEGVGDIYLDKIMDANYPFVTSWEETIEGCCEYFE